MRQRSADYRIWLVAGLLLAAAMTNLNCANNTQRRIMGPYSFSADIVPSARLLAMLPQGTELAPSYLGICAYLIQAGNGHYVLIDSGAQNQTQTLVQLLAAQNVKPADIEMVVCTHAHSDHVGSCAFLQRHGAKIAIHKSAGEIVDGTPPFRDPNARRSAPDEPPVEPFRPDVRFSDGDVLQVGDIELRVIHTPGHTPDSSSFVLNRPSHTVLFAGDLYGWYIIDWGSDQKQMLASVRKAAKIGADYCCFGHYLVNEDVPAFWVTLEKSVADGIFQLVDRHHYSPYVQRSGKKVLLSRPNQ